MPEELPGDDDFNQPPSFFPKEPEEDQPTISLGDPVEVRIDGVYSQEHNGQVTRFVLLTDGIRELRISISAELAMAISMPLENARPDRPVTHDLMKTVIERLEGDLDRIVIDDLWNAIYYAKIYLLSGNEEIAIDSRPSDAIALAVRFDVPIYVLEGILNSADD